MSLKSSPFQSLSRTFEISWLLSLAGGAACAARCSDVSTWRSILVTAHYLSRKLMMYYDSELHWNFSSLNGLQTKTNLLCFVLVSDKCQY